MSLTVCLDCGFGHRCHLEDKSTSELYTEIGRLTEIAEARRRLNDALTNPLSWAEYHAEKCEAARYATDLKTAILAIHHQDTKGGKFCVGCWEGGGCDGAVSWPCETARLVLPKEKS